jgi:hypothetical protein
VTLKIDAPNYEEKFNRQTLIINNRIEHPYKYRLLNPFITQSYFLIFKNFLSEKTAFILSYATQNFLVFLLLFYSFSKFLFVWFDDIGRIIGLLMLGVIIPLTLTGWDVQGDISTAGLMALGFYFINSNRENLLLPVLIVGAFNELQIVLLILFYFFSKKENIKLPKVWLKTIIFIAVFIIVYIFIYMIRGGDTGTDIRIWSSRKDLMFNIANLNFIILWAVLILPLLFLGMKNFKTKPEFLRINILTVIPVFYVIAIFILARMREIDKALTIFIILIPLALFTLIPSHLKTKTQES